MKSIKIFIMLVLVLSLVSSFALISNAPAGLVNLATMEGATHHWSGTWGDQKALKYNIRMVLMNGIQL